MERKINDKIQAVDECGRWENGKVVEVYANGDCNVTFDGWNEEYNRIAPPHLVRCRLDPGSGEFQISIFLVIFHAFHL